MSDTIVLGDGMIGVDMGGGYIEKVSGSRTARREPASGIFTDADAARAQRRAIGEILPGKLGMKWCSAHDPGDNGGWVALDDFTLDARYRDGRYPVCKACRAREERRRYALLREAEGRSVRAYRRRGVAQE